MKLGVLIWLHWKLFTNQIKDKIIFRSYLSYIFMLLIIFLFFFGIGYIIALLVNYYVGIKQGSSWVKTASSIYNAIIFTFLFVKIFSPNRLIEPIALKTLNCYPFSFYIFSFVDFCFGMIDKTYIILYGLILGFLFGVGVFGLSLTLSFLFLLISLLQIIIIHLLYEFFWGLIIIINLSRKIVFYIFVALILSLVYLFLNNKIPFEALYNYSPIGFTFNTIYYTSKNYSLQLLSLSLWFFVLIIFSSYIFVNIIRKIGINLSVENTITSYYQSKENRRNIFQIFNSVTPNLFPYIEKDFKYILRSRRTLISLAVEIILCFAILNKLFIEQHLKNETIYFNIFLVAAIPTMIWDYYLSNSWGFEKSGFGFYIILSSNYKNMIVSKNLSFIIIRLPLLVSVSVAFGLVSNISFIPLVLFLQLILMILLITLSNFNAIRNPYPIDLNENIFSNKRNIGFSSTGFFYLLINLFVPIVLLIIQGIIYNYIYKLLFLIFVFLIFILLYFSRLKYWSKLIILRQELIYQKLIKS